MAIVYAFQGLRDERNRKNSPEGRSQQVLVAGSSKSRRRWREIKQQLLAAVPCREHVGKKLVVGSTGWTGDGTIMRREGDRPTEQVVTSWAIGTRKVTHADLLSRIAAVNVKKGCMAAVNNGCCQGRLLSRKAAVILTLPLKLSSWILNA
ncbi:hypothetical protein LXL04_013618 [Taraxacum kok-saghyz]